MSQIGFIPPPHYVPDKLFTFEEPENTEWTIIDKLEQENFQQDEEDFSYGYVPSFACAIFLVRNSVNDQEAFMRVYQQIPIKGTEFSSPEERAQQAVSSFHGEFEAMKAFHEKESTITPALLGYKEESQDTQGIVPGGYVIQFVFERVPGVPLAEDRILPGFGAPLHSFFQKAESERIEIRKQFDEGYRKLQELGWEPAYPWANNLIWDASSTKLYFVDFRESRRTGERDKNIIEDSEGEQEEEELPMSTIWNSWGLAIAPSDPKDREDLSKWTL